MPQLPPQVLAIESPCIGVCTLDERGQCMGCHRSTEEIGGWSMYSDQERRRIMAELPERAARYLAGA